MNDMVAAAAKQDLVPFFANRFIPVRSGVYCDFQESRLQAFFAGSIHRLAAFRPFRRSRDFLRGNRHLPREKQCLQGQCSQQPCRQPCRQRCPAPACCCCQYQRCLSPTSGGKYAQNPRQRGTRQRFARHAISRFTRIIYVRDGGKTAFRLPGAAKRHCRVAYLAPQVPFRFQILQPGWIGFPCVMVSGQESPLMRARLTATHPTYMPKVGNDASLVSPATV